MKKIFSIIIFSTSVLLFLINSYQFVFASTDTNTEIRILPTSPLYFLKEWQREIKLFLTFDAIKKIEIETEISDEKLKELQALIQKESQKERVRGPTSIKSGQVLMRAFSTYEKSKKRLAKRLESLKEISQNPNVDRLLDKIVEQEVRHIEIFEKIVQRAGYDGANVPVIRGSALFVTKSVISKDSPEKFSQRVKSAIEKLPEEELKSLRAIEIIDGLTEDLESPVAAPLMQVRGEYFEKLNKEIEESPGIEDRVLEKIKTLPGDPIKHLMVLEELEQDAALRGIEKKDIRRGMVIAKPELISSAKEALIEEVSSKEDIKQKAEEQIKKAEEAIRKLEDYLNQFSILPPRDKDKPFRTNQVEVNQTVVQTLLNQAKEHLQKAKKAFEEGKYGEAFGLAVSAQSLAENGIRKLISEFSKPQPLPVPTPSSKPSEAPAPLTPQKQPACPTITPACPLENCLKAAKELEKTYPGCDYTSLCEKQCQIEECGPMPLYPIKEGCERVCKDGKWQDICKPTEIREREPIKRESIICTQEWNPVCGEDDQTYSNECMARAAGVKVKHTGVCQVERPQPSSEQQPPFEIEGRIQF